MSSLHPSRQLAALMLLLLCGVFGPTANLLAAAPPTPVSMPKTVNDIALQQAKAKFEILLGFGLYTRWPDGAFERPQEGPNIAKVGIVGDNPQVEQLEILAAGRQIAGRQVVVRHYRSLLDVEPCQILLITNSLPRGDRLALIEKYKSSPVLLAGETPGFCLEGGGLNFHLENGSVKFVLNQPALAKQKLTIDPRFSRLARPNNPPAPKKAQPAAAPVNQIRQPGKVRPSPGLRPDPSGGKRP